MSITLIPNKTCSKCAGKMYFWHEPQNMVDPFLIACVDCGGVEYKGNDIMEVNRRMGKLYTPSNRKVTSKHPIKIPPIPPRPQNSKYASNPFSSPTGRAPARQSMQDLIKDLLNGAENCTKPTKKWTMKEAYEANKKAEKCVVCGKTLSFHPSCSVLYCKCIETLPKERTA